MLTAYLASSSGQADNVGLVTHSRGSTRMTPDTSSSLLERVRNPADGAAWDRFSKLYTPLLRNWLRHQHRLQDQDADDLVAEVLEVLVRELPRFHYDRSQGSFRGWLRTILANRLRNFWRHHRSLPAVMNDSDLGNILDQLEDPRSELSELFERQHNEVVARRLLDVIQADFEPTTWEAFRRVVIDGEKPAVVAAALGMAPQSVHAAKYRVLQRLRQEGKGLID
jgi:RNA polymerase sigma-70 factor (ECF subfamily)